MKRIWSLMMIALLLFCVMGTTVFADASYEATVLSELSIMQGDPNGSMRYGDKVSRAECAKIVVQASKYRNLVDTSSKRSAFQDVTAEHWAAPYVTVGVKNGLFKGYFDATFRPSNTVTYEEAITMLLRVLDYTDADVGDEWPYDQIDMAKKLGMLDGVAKTMGEELTRRDVSKMVYNTLNAKAKGAQEAYVKAFDRTVGPITVTSSFWYEELGADSAVKVVRDGVESSVSAVRMNDIAYYMVEYNKVLVYSKKVTGIYESATPNKDTPVSVTVSGVTYHIEGDDAYSKLSSNGSISYGDTVTLLLGKSGDVAGVATNLTDDAEVTGFLSAVGTKDTSVSGKTVKKPYIRIVRPSGEICEYTTEKNYESYLNRAVKVKLDNGLATVSSIVSNQNIYGKVVWDSEVRSIGSHTLASDVKIIETSTTETGETATVATVYPQRLNGLKISEEDVLYVSKNTLGNIDEMILRDVTGDMHTYGVVISAKNNTEGNRLSGSYEYLVDGTENTLNTQNQTFGVASGQAVKIKSNGRTITSMMPLTQIKASKITGISGATITINNSKYTMSDKVQIYVKGSYTNPYSMITVDELLEIADEYQVSVYTDKDTLAGGRVRIIILRNN
ncbi:MAG: S-layer homology domain-containing protein [Clostridia bacterium]|nr:S-layer homology domain-containing protein [Clostridia bacterium]